MLIVVSPAKSLNFDPVDLPKQTHHPFLKETKKLVGVMKKKSAGDLKALMNISDKIADLNVDRYHSFKFPFNEKNAKAAIFAFTGDVYRGLDIDQFDTKDLTYAQDHLRILSGLYGLLKPLDLIQPYRLEMGTQLQVNSSNNLYDFWGEKITKALNESLVTQKKPYLINLASQEYFKAIKINKLKGKIIDIHFKELRDGDYKIISFSAKKARGMMSRYIIKNRIEDIEKLKGFHEEEYLFNDELSTENSLTFTR